MGFFSKVKDKLGIGGVKAVLEVPKSVSKTVDFIEGKIILTTKSEQEITDIEVTLIEDFSIGSDDEKTQKRFELGKVTFNDHFSISPGETKEIPFCLPFAFIKSKSDNMQDKGGFMGALGTASKFLDSEKSKFSVQASIDVKSAFIDPLETKTIKFTA